MKFIAVVLFQLPLCIKDDDHLGGAYYEMANLIVSNTGDTTNNTIIPSP